MSSYVGDEALESRCRERLRVLGGSTPPTSEDELVDLLVRLRGKPINFEYQVFPGGRITGYVRRETDADTIVLPEGTSPTYVNWVKRHELSHLLVEPNDTSATNVVSVVESEVFVGDVQLRCDRTSSVEQEVEFTASLMAEVMSLSRLNRIASRGFSALLGVPPRNRRR